VVRFTVYTNTTKIQGAEYMVQFNLFFGVTDIIIQLLEVGADLSTTHEARQALDSLITDFKESEGVATSEIENEQLREYFQVIENIKSLNNILVRGLPSLPDARDPEEAKLRVEIFAILNNLLKVGITSCNVHETHMQLDAILAEHEQF